MGTNLRTVDLFLLESEVFLSNGLASTPMSSVIRYLWRERAEGRFDQEKRTHSCMKEDYSVLVTLAKSLTLSWLNYGLGLEAVAG